MHALQYICSLLCALGLSNEGAACRCRSWWVYIRSKGVNQTKMNRFVLFSEKNKNNAVHARFGRPPVVGPLDVPCTRTTHTSQHSKECRMWLLGLRGQHDSIDSSSVVSLPFTAIVRRRSFYQMPANSNDSISQNCSCLCWPCTATTNSNHITLQRLCVCVYIGWVHSSFFFLGLLCSTFNKRITTM